MSIEDRHDASGAIVQGVLAETLSSYRNGKMDEDENLCLVWDAPSLDAEGRREMMDHLISAWEEVREIHARATNRMAESKETGTTTVVAFLGFERGRTGSPETGYYRAEKTER